MELLENSDQSSNVSMDGNIGTFRRSQSPDKSNDSNVQPGSSVDDSASSLSATIREFRNDHVRIYILHTEINFKTILFKNYDLH